MSIRSPLAIVTKSDSITLSYPANGSSNTEPLKIFLKIHKEGDGEDDGWNIEVTTNTDPTNTSTLPLSSYQWATVGDYDPWFLPDDCAEIHLPEELAKLRNQKLLNFNTYSDGTHNLLKLTSDYLNLSQKSKEPIT